jgi:hypothetical protein
MEELVSENVSNELLFLNNIYSFRLHLLVDKGIAFLLYKKCPMNETCARPPTTFLKLNVIQWKGVQHASLLPSSDLMDFFIVWQFISFVCIRFLTIIFTL